tara:strand:- start:240 stop:365 length:126 start_codon:yes stop_codon:yes gene_type:complete
MSKETYQEIKKITGEEFKDFLSKLDYVLDNGSVTLSKKSFN